MFARVNDTRLYYETHGQGLPMLLMHGGLGLDHTYFFPWLAPLGSQMELICYDHRGCGRSERPQDMSGISHATWAEDADALRAHLGHDRMVLFGHSYGGFLAQEYALRYAEHLAGLILCCTAPALDYLDVILANATARGTAEQLEALEAVMSGTVTEDAEWQKRWITYLPLYFRKYDPAFGDAMDGRTLYSAAALNHGNAHCLPVFNTLDRLSRISVPTLILSGAHDWITPPAQGGERIHARLLNSELVVFEESGHFPFLEERDAFLQAVRDWTACRGREAPRRPTWGSALGAER